MNRECVWYAILSAWREIATANDRSFNNNVVPSSTFCSFVCLFRQWGVDLQVGCSKQDSDMRRWVLSRTIRSSLAKLPQKKSDLEKLFEI